MDFSGRYIVPAPPSVVWTALNDPEVLKACVPGCQALTKSGDDHFDATATLKIGPMKATFKAGITLAEHALLRTDPTTRSCQPWPWARPNVEGGRRTLAGSSWWR